MFGPMPWGFLWGHLEALLYLLMIGFVEYSSGPGDLTSREEHIFVLVPRKDFFIALFRGLRVPYMFDTLLTLSTCLIGQHGSLEGKCLFITDLVQTFLLYLEYSHGILLK